jgi:antitoxin component of MazEF toxin-antitoxin module
MQVAKWGKSLAVRLPAELVRELGLKDGDQIDLVRDDGQVNCSRKAGLSWDEKGRFSRTRPLTALPPW